MTGPKGVPLTPDEMRFSLTHRRVDQQTFRAALMATPEGRRDDWLDQVFGLGAPPHDGPELPRGCVPYLPSSVNTLLRLIDIVGLQSHDVFVDIGSGLGRATILTSLLTGATAIGIEIQSELVRSSRELASSLHAERVSVVEGDAVKLAAHLTSGTVFFLYCPFSGDRLEKVLDDLEPIAQTRVIHVCSIDLPLPSRSWLVPLSLSGDLAIYRTTLRPHLLP